MPDILLLIALAVLAMGAVYFFVSRRSTSTPAIPAAPSAAPSAAPDTGADALAEPYKLSYELDGQVLFEVEPAFFEPKQKYEEWTHEPKLKVALQKVVRQLPALAGKLRDPRVIKVVFPSEVMQGLANGKLELMKASSGGLRTIAIDAITNKIVDHGLLIRQLDTIASTAFTWHVLAAITSQRFLVDINARLRHIEESVKSIQHFLENEQKGKIIGNLSYMKTIAATLQNHGLDEVDIMTYNNQLEAIERECVQVAHTAELELNRVLELIGRLDLSAIGGVFGGLKGKMEEAKTQITHFDHHYRLLQQVLFTRLCACQLKLSLPSARTPIRTRLSGISQQCENNYLLIEKFRQQIVQKTEQLQGKLSFDSTDEKHQKVLRDHYSPVLELAVEKHHALQQITRSLDTELQAQDRVMATPLEFMIELGEDRGVKRISRVRS